MIYWGAALLKWNWGLGRQWAKCEPGVRPGSTEGQEYPGVYLQAKLLLTSDHYSLPKTPKIRLEYHNQFWIPSTKKMKKVIK